MKPFKPDFRRLEKALFGGQPDRVPLLELAIDPLIKSQFLGRKVVNLSDEVDFFVSAGYDGFKLSPGVEFIPAPPEDGKRTAQHQPLDRTRRWASEAQGAITSQKEFEAYSWPRKEGIDFSAFEEAEKILPPGMKVIGHYGDIFTWLWELMGFETFAFALTEDLPLVEAMFEKLGDLIIWMFEQMADFPRVGALWYSDDLAYKTGLMVSPKIYRDYLFPWMERIGDMCKEKNIPYIYHSDGNLWPVMDDLLNCGINALHPIEPGAMDIREVKRKYGGRLCLIGNVDLGYTLTRGTPEEVQQEVKALIRDLGPGGGYCLGSSNTVTDYVPVENFRAMVEAAHRYGEYPLK